MLRKDARAAVRGMGNFCMICGYGVVVDIHHIDGDRKNNEVSNLVILCPNHHAEVHRGFITIDGPTLEHIGVAPKKRQVEASVVEWAYFEDVTYP